MLNSLTSDDASPQDGGNLQALESTFAPEATIPLGLTDIGHWGGRETILLVEDETLVRKSIAEALQLAGYRVVIAGSATQALEVYHQLSPPLDLLLADIILPGISGCELAQDLLFLCPNIRIMLMSGYAEQISPCELSPFPKEYLSKPFSISTLLQRVRNALDSNPFDFGASH